MLHPTQELEPPAIPGRFTTCPKHGVDLRETCPGCRSDITFATTSLTSCQNCGYDLSAIHLQPAPDSTVELARLIARIIGHEEFNTNHRFCPEIESLPLNEAIQLFLLLASQIHGRARSTGDILAKAISLDDLRHLTARSMNILSNWPHNFRDYLRSTHEPHKIPTNILSRFGPLYDVLFKLMPDEKFEFMRQEFNRFAGENWEGHVNRRNKHLTGLQQKFIVMDKAMEISGLGENRLRQAIADGDIHAESSTRGAKTFTMIDPASLDTFIALNADLIGLTDAAFLLSVKKPTVQALADAQIIKVHKRPENKKNGLWWIRRSSIESLMQSIHANLPSLEISNTGSILSFHGLSAMCGRFGTSLPELIRVIVEGDIRPVGLDKSKKGLQEFLFDHQEILNWCIAKSPTRKNGMTNYDAAHALGLKMEVVRHLIQTGRITKIPSNGLHDLDPASVSGFHEKYVSVAKIATGLGTSSTKLMQILKEVEISPAIGPSVDGCRQYFYLKVDIGDIDLAELIRRN